MSIIWDFNFLIASSNTHYKLLINLKLPVFEV